MKYELYQVKSGTQVVQWRWRLVATSNGKTIASGESYMNRVDAVSAVNLVMDTTRQTPFVEVAG